MEKKKEYLSSSFKSIAGLFQKNLFLRNIKGIYYYIDSILLLFSKKVKKNKSVEKKKILILYNIALGDGVIFRCVTSQLRKIYPKNKFELDIVCQKGLEKIYSLDNTFDDIIPINFSKSTINLKERLNSFRILRKKRYDVVIDPVGISEWTTNVFFTRGALGNKKIGVIEFNSKLYCSKRKINRIYNELIEIEDNNLSLLEYYTRVFNKLSNSNLFDMDLKKIPTKKNSFKLPSKYFVVFPTASLELKRWDLNKYAKLTEKVYKKLNMPVVLLGSKPDKEVIDKYVSLTNDVEFIDLVDKTNLNDYIDILSKASLVITNDTSCYHIAMMQQVPTAIISGGYTYNKYIQYPKDKRYIEPCIIVHKMDCFNCFNRCPYLKQGDKNWPCLEKVSVDYAYKKIEDYIKKNKIGK